MKSLKEIAQAMYPVSGSHGWNHIQDVLTRAKAMRQAEGKDWTEDDDAGVMFHDIGLYPDGPDKPEQREGHEERGAAIAGQLLADHFTAKRLARIIAAIREHRGSYKGSYTSELSDLVSSADRNPPDLMHGLRRAQTWNVEHGISGQPGYDRIAAHLREKYGTGGYGRFPQHYQSLYAKELEDYRKTVDSLTGDKVRELLEQG